MLFDVQTNVLNAIESTLELVHPMEMAQQALPTNHLLARIQQLEKDLDKSQEEACTHSQHLVQAFSTSSAPARTSPSH